MSSTAMFLLARGPRGRDLTLDLTPESVRVRVAAPRRAGAEKAPLPHHGGSITFSTDVNVGLKTVVGWIKAKLRTLRQRLRAPSIVDRVVVRVTLVEAAKERQREEEARAQGTKYEEQFGGIGYTLSPPARGRYISRQRDQSVRERAYRIDLAGIDTDLLMVLAREIRGAFGQESVLVDNRNTGEKPYYVGAPDAPDAPKADPAPKTAGRRYDDVRLG